MLLMLLILLIAVLIFTSGVFIGVAITAKNFKKALTDEIVRKYNDSKEKGLKSEVSKNEKA